MNFRAKGGRYGCRRRRRKRDKVAVTEVGKETRSTRAGRETEFTRSRRETRFKSQEKVARQSRRDRNKDRDKAAS